MRDMFAAIGPFNWKSAQARMIETRSADGVGRRELGWAAAELLVAAALVVGANIFDVIPVSETPWLVAIGWLSLRRRGLSWRSVGFQRPSSWVRTIWVALAAGVVLQLLSEFVVERLFGRPDLSEFQFLVGNLPAALGMLALVWTIAAFGEELSYRGYVLERAAALGQHSSSAYLVGMVVVSILFGIGHFYQGVSGVLGSTVSGLLFGVLYLTGGRNLWLPILAHGISDTIGLALIYLGVAPVSQG
jgi:membrane protease YdiL (CAAX protease family)